MQMDTPQHTATPLSKEQIRALTAFENLASEKIMVIQTLEQCLTLHDQLSSIAVFGFDSESKPTFKVGENRPDRMLSSLQHTIPPMFFKLVPKFWIF
jgi:hypothetical protein